MSKITTLDISQGYLVRGNDIGLRIRSTKHSGGLGKESKKIWCLTLKQDVCDKTIEVEHQLTEEDAEALWSKCSGKLRKTRYVFMTLNKYEEDIWEVDFFYDENDDLYFAMAEIELSFGAERPPVPEFLENFVIFEVPLTDSRFSNKKLGDVEYSRNLYKELKGIENVCKS
jgi:CYTH domain-containing protein